MGRIADQVSGTSSAVGQYSAGIALAGCMLYSVLWTVSFASGTQNGDIISFFKWLAKAMFLIALAGAGSMYHEYVTSTFMSAPAEIGQVIANGGLSGSVKLDANGQLNIGTALDIAGSQGVCAGLSIWEQAGMLPSASTIGYFLAGFIVIIGAALFVTVAAGLAFMAYASLAVVLALGPLFIIAGIWDSTRPMFESFLRTAMNYSLYGVVLMVIVGMAIGMVTAFSNDDIGNLGDIGDLRDALSVAIRSLVAFAIATALLMKADDISASLVGGISLGGAGLAGRAAGIAAAPAKGAMAAAKVAQNPAKAMGEFAGGQFHRNPSTGQTSFQSAAETRSAHSSALSAARKRNTISK